MPRSRNGVLVKVGQTVDIIPSMGVECVTRGVVSGIDGEYILVDLVINGVTITVVERYGCEIIA